MGAGPCGLAVGAAARRAGLSCVLFDRRCLTSTIVDYPVYATFFSTAEKLEIADVPFTLARGKPRREDALKYYRRVAERFSLDVRQYTEVERIEGRRGDFRLHTRRTGTGDRGPSHERADTGGETATWHARTVVAATGTFHEPNLLGIPGEELPKVRHWFDEPLPCWDLDVLVVGGGNSAVESALELYRAGARVTFVHFEHELDPGVKPWLLPDIRNRFDEESIAVRWGTRLIEVRPRSVVLRGEETGETVEIANDRVYAMTGWRPDPGLLRAAGVEVDDRGVPAHDPETMETNVPGLHIAGVAAAGTERDRLFIENGVEHGPRIVRALRERAAAESAEPVGEE